MSKAAYITPATTSLVSVDAFATVHVTSRCSLFSNDNSKVHTNLHCLALCHAAMHPCTQSAHERQNTQTSGHEQNLTSSMWTCVPDVHHKLSVGDSDVSSSMQHKSMIQNPKEADCFIATQQCSCWQSAMMLMQTLNSCTNHVPARVDRWV